MKKILLILTIVYSGSYTYSQDIQQLPQSWWQIGIGLGELPTGGSFKPSITLGYNFNDKIYTGIIYQFSDNIQRNQSSINARSAEIDGLVSAAENVGQRFLVQCRYTPFKNGPYLSAGFVFNDKDSEEMHFDSRSRELDNDTYEGDISITQTRPAGGGIALGIGYQYTFSNGIALNAEWTPSWFSGYAKPVYEFGGSANISEKDQKEIENRMTEEFSSSVTNLYKVFHIGVAYKFK